MDSMDGVGVVVGRTPSQDEEVKEETYVIAPKEMNLKHDECLRVHKALYGLRQSPKAWQKSEADLERLP